MERWKDVIGYVGLYEVGDHGRVRSVNRVVRHSRGGPKRLKGRVKSLTPINTSGHLGVTLSVNGVCTKVLVHRLVAAAWLGPCPDGLEVCHGPAGHLDNSVSNLSYDTHKENCLRDRRRDGTDCGRPVRRSDGVEYPSIVQAAEESGCYAPSIVAVCNGRRKTTGGYGWAHIDSHTGSTIWEVESYKTQRVRRSDGVEYPSIVQAAEESGCRTQGITEVCRDRQKTTNGYGWEYAD